MHTHQYFFSSFALLVGMASNCVFGPMDGSSADVTAEREGRQPVSSEQFFRKEQQLQEEQLQTDEHPYQDQGAAAQQEQVQFACNQQIFRKEELLQAGEHGDHDQKSPMASEDPQVEVARRLIECFASTSFPGEANFLASNEKEKLLSKLHEPTILNQVISLVVPRHAWLTLDAQLRGLSIPLFDLFQLGGVSPNLEDKNKMSILGILVGDQSLTLYGPYTWEKAIQLLLDRGAVVSPPSLNGHSYDDPTRPLQAALKSDHHTFKKLVRYNKGKEVQGCDKYILPHLIDEGYDQQVVQALIEQGARVDDPNGILYRSPLYCAILHGKMDIAKLLVQHGASVKGIDVIHMPDKEKVTLEHRKKIMDELNAISAM